MELPVDGRSDMFSTGDILYQFLTGERPFAGSATTTMQKVLKEDPLPPSSLNVQAPAGMDAVVRKALAKRPDDRFQTAREFAEALRAAAPAASSSTAEATLIATLIATPDATVLGTIAPKPAAPVAPVVTPSVSTTPPGRKSQKAAVALMIAVAVVAVAALAWYLIQRPSAAPATVTASSSPPPAPAVATAPAVAPVPATAAGTMLISAVGLIDPSDPRYRADK